MIKYISILLLSLLLVSCINNTPYKETKYTGVIISKGKEEPTGKSNGTYFILVKENRENKIIRINVTVPEWYSIDVDSIYSGYISNYRMCSYGNTRDFEKNLYGE